MKLYQLVNRVTVQEAINLVAGGSKNIVAIVDGESYFVDSYNVFDKDDVVFYFVDYQKLDVIKLIDHLRSGEEDLISVSHNLYNSEMFTNMKNTQYDI